MQNVKWGFSKETRGIRDSSSDSSHSLEHRVRFRFELDVPIVEEIEFYAERDSGLNPCGARKG